MGSIWGLAICGRDRSPWREDRRDHWWRFIVSCSGDSKILEIPVLRDDHQGRQQLLLGAGLSLWDKLIMLQKTEIDKEKCTGLWSPKDFDPVPDIRHRTIYSVVSWIGFVLIVTVHLFFPLRVQKYATHILFLGAHSWAVLDFYP